MDWSSFKELGNLGGLALTVYVLIQGMIKLATKWTDDLKESAAREREGRGSLEKLYADTLSSINANTTALVDLKGAVGARNLEDTWVGQRRGAPPTAPAS